jgi:hypothetical protein
LKSFFFLKKKMLGTVRRSALPDPDTPPTTPTATQLPPTDAAPKNKPGPRQGQKHAATVVKETNAAKAAKMHAQKKQRALRALEQHRLTHGPPTRSLNAGGGSLKRKTTHETPMEKWKRLQAELAASPNPPVTAKERMGFFPRAGPTQRFLTNDEIRIAIQSLSILHQECAEEEKSTYGQQIFPNVSKQMGISISTLYELWDEWLEAGCTVLPQSYADLPRVTKACTIIKVHSGNIRLFILERKLEGKVVEVLNVQTFLKDEHGFDVERESLRLAMVKMGLKWGKKHKLMVST